MATQTLPIISVTGTKGKTTVVSVLADVLQRQGRNVLHVETSGHFVNSERRSESGDSLQIWGIRTVTAMPGKYLGEFLHHPALQDQPVAVLECSFSCSTRGLGYGAHKVGVFLNVFEDHLDPRGTIKTRHDLALAKSFIFSAIDDQGYAVFNADDELVCDMLSKIPAERNIRLVPCGVAFAHFDMQKHLSQGGVAVTVESGAIVLKSASETIVLCTLTSLPWAFNGAFTPSIMNMLHVCGAVYAFMDGQLPVSYRSLFEGTRLNPSTGRLVVMKAANGATIIGDYAHEKQSLQAIAALGSTLVRDRGKLIGVVRLAHERSDSMLRETGHVIGEAFDKVVVYDKIDGYWRQPAKPYIKRYPQVVGRTSKIVANACKERNADVTRILREDEAITFSASQVKPSDVVIVILNDDIARSLEFIKQAFQAEYL